MPSRLTVPLTETCTPILPSPSPAHFVVFSINPTTNNPSPLHTLLQIPFKQRRSNPDTVFPSCSSSFHLYACLIHLHLILIVYEDISYFICILVIVCRFYLPCSCLSSISFHQFYITICFLLRLLFV